MYQTVGLSQPNENQVHAGRRRRVRRQIRFRCIAGYPKEDRVRQVALFEKEPGLQFKGILENVSRSSSHF